ncbi:hypothetical protein SAMN06265222_106192 [Neorhodopirellula lusitana]|uniref:Uncharacterized protein n=1 Tax=Neorhodopirellula lusitana TaxID=445327 RepID=A0ABY1Q4C8_9BACT|nr:hypothetical protein [Neorhodopirellula lusitana]SMP59249.1 hypothetical protein SAMN06265222_106192 [Neorhodopirellula lusitana]
MNDINPQIDNQLDRLAEICYQMLKGEQAVDLDQSEALLKALVTNGYSRAKGHSLQVDLESRVKDKWPEPTMHRGGELSSLTDDLQKRFEKFATWESRQPEEESKAKAANISSATNA